MPAVKLTALRAMVHHVTRKYAMEPDRLGSVKLHKILWWAEIRSLQRLGEQVADETFHKEQFGPFSVHLNDVVADLQSAGLLHVRKATDEFEPDLYVGKGEPDRDALTDEQWRILDYVVDGIIRDHSAGSISEKSHGPVWEAVELYEPMPVGAAALRWVPTSEADKERMRERLNL